MLKKFLEKNKLNAFWVSSEENIFYILSSTSKGKEELITKDSKILFTKDKTFIFAHPLEIISLKKYLSIKKAEILSLEKKTLKAIIDKEKIKKIGFEKNHLTVWQLENLQKIWGKKIILKGYFEVIEEIRTQKKIMEINKIKSSANLTDKVLQTSLPFIKEGISEKKLALILQNIGQEKGAQKAFDFIVAFGKNSACPHHLPSFKKLTKNEAILIDLGFKKNQYLSDLSRSFFLGSPSQEWLKIFQLVIKAQKKAIKTIKIKQNCNESFKKVKKVFTSQRKGKYFSHALGHGLGLCIHEKPHISPRSKEVFEKNMVFSLEPGIYLPQKFGIRIEDIFALTHQGLRQLSKFPKNIENMILN